MVITTVFGSREDLIYNESNRHRNYRNLSANPQKNWKKIIKSQEKKKLDECLQSVQEPPESLQC